VRQRPEAAGEYFWGYETFWVYRRGLGSGRGALEPALLRLDLERRTSRVTAVTRVAADGSTRKVTVALLEPQILAEALDEERASRQPVELDRLPEHVWRAVLAIEDARFFAHEGVDPRSVARALLKNALAGRVTQGGSTITQQLVKMRDLTPKRTMGRKVSEAVRALALEAQYDKREILEAYLDAVYFGHVEGVAVHGIGAAARVYFSRRAEELDLGQAAVLAGMIQGPNRLQPHRHPQASRQRQLAVLDRLEKLDWAPVDAIARARRAGLPRVRLSPPRVQAARSLLAWIREEAERRAPRRLAAERGVVVHTTIDPFLQRVAEDAVREGLDALRRRDSRLARLPLSAALVALDGASGDVLATVGGDPAQRADSFDRVRRARRQPGSAVKPFVLLEAFEDCGRGRSLNPASLVRDEPVVLRLPGGDWRPANPDRSFRGPVTVRDALVDSLNVPFVRVARWCGFEATARRFGSLGLGLGASPPPSFVLGAVEAAPLELVTAYSVFATLGDRARPRLVARVGTPSGRRLGRQRSARSRVAGAESSFLVRDLMRQAVESGTAARAKLAEFEEWGKTGTSSDGRDAWFVGGTGSLVAAVWVGIDSGEALGLGGAGAAAPIWAELMARAAASRPETTEIRPPGVVERWVDPASGLRVPGPQGGARPYLVRRGHEPPRARPWRRAADVVD
jgi:penicillin-binding protein 1B